MTGGGVCPPMCHEGLNFLSCQDKLRVVKEKPVEIVKMLNRQNRSLSVSGRTNLQTVGEASSWRVSFVVTRKIAKQLKEIGWILFYELVTVKVRRKVARRADSKSRPEKPVAGMKSGACKEPDITSFLAL